MSKMLWKPSRARTINSNMYRFMGFVNGRYGEDFTEYAPDYQWSVEKIPNFWAAFSKRGVSFKTFNLPKVKSKIPDYERGKVKILTAGIYGIFRGLKFEHDAEIGLPGIRSEGVGLSTRQGVKSKWAF